MRFKNSLGRYAAMGLALSAVSLPLSATEFLSQTTPSLSSPLSSSQVHTATKERIDATRVDSFEMVTVPMEDASTLTLIELDGSPMTLDQAMAEISAAEYRFAGRDGSWAASNRAQDLSTRLTANGLAVSQRTGLLDWTLGMRLTAFGRQDSMTSAATPVVAAAGTLRGQVGRREGSRTSAGEQTTRVELRREGLTEWYLNDDRGLEQGFTFLSRPAGDGMTPIALDLAVSGLTPKQIDPHAISLMADQGGDILRYAKLFVVDATGRELNAWMTAGNGSIRIEFTDLGATYPVVVDPLLTSFASGVIGAPGDRLGWDVESAGRTNADAIDDIIIGVPRFDVVSIPHVAPRDCNGDLDTTDPNEGAGGTCPTALDSGAAFVYKGSSPAGTLVASYGFIGTYTGATRRPPQADSHMGWAVSGAGDVNADGRDDVLVGVPDYDEPTPAGVDGGHFFVLFHNAAGLPFASQMFASAAPPLTGANAGLIGEKRGFSLAKVGRHDGPRANCPGTVAFGPTVQCIGSDFAVGAPGFDTTGFPADAGVGRVYVGSQAGAAFLYSGPGGDVAEHAGWSVGGTSDVDGNGFDEAFWGTPNFDYDGVTVDPGGFVISYGDVDPFTAPAYQVWFQLGEDNMHLGLSLAGGFDTNGDAPLEDYVIGIPHSDFFGNPDAGAVINFHGHPTDPAGVPQFIFNFDDQPFSQFGYALSLDGSDGCDQLADLLVGVPKYDLGAPGDQGAALEYTSVENLGINPAFPSWAVSQGNARGEFGTSIAWSDINGDNKSDGIVGEPLSFSQSGVAYAYLGTSVDTTPPRIEPSLTAPICLWPPNHRYECFEYADFAPFATDNCGTPTVVFVSCTSNEPDNGLGDGDTENDCTIGPGGQSFCVRAERSGQGGGRRYTVVAAATDPAGNFASAPIGLIYVPHDMSEPEDREACR